MDARLQGFTKRAAYHGMTPVQAEHLYKLAFGADDFQQLGNKAMDLGQQGFDWLKDKGSQGMDWARNNGPGMLQQAKEKLQLGNPGYSIDNAPNPNPTGGGNSAMNNALYAGLPTAALGAGVGALGGGMMDKKNRMRGALLGGLGGGALGFAGGSINRANHLADNTRDEFAGQQQGFADTARTNALRYENNLPLDGGSPEQAEFTKWLQDSASQSERQVGNIKAAPWHQFFGPQQLKNLRPMQAPELNTTGF